jgi:hypothetical protein
MQETMAQVCRWRSMPEQVRTEADDFSSVSAKETMYYVARAWDRMADDLEGRLSKSETEQMIDERTEGRRG